MEEETLLTGKVNPLWGFDPIDLLKRIHFPNDENEYKIRHSHAARVLAIQKIYESDNKPSNPKKVYISGPGMQQAEENPDSEEIAFQQTSKIQQLQLARSAAALIIQAVFRGWATRKRFILIVNALVSIQTHRDGILVDAELPPIKDLRVQERLRRKYNLYCGFFDRKNLIPPEYSQYCAAIIQAVWKKSRVYHAYQKYKGTVKPRLTKLKKAHSIETEREQEKEEALQFLNSVAQKTTEAEDMRHQAALIIQRVWKKYYNTRIYLFYKDLIKIRERADPYQMLKYINPKEAQLIDRSLALHVRFRLGGTQFPPTIYYKIYLHRNMIDLNSFAPRDYTAQSSKQVLPATLFLKTQDSLPSKNPMQEWYERLDTNDWRPVLEIPGQMSSNSIIQDKKKNLFHYSKIKRQQDLLKKRKLKRLEWMKKLYEFGKKGESKHGGKWFDINKGLEFTSELSEKVPIKKVSVDMDAVEVEINRIMQEMEDNNPQNELINWTRALDYDSYHAHWLELAATAPSDLIVQNPLLDFIDSYTEIDKLDMNDIEDLHHSEEIQFVDLDQKSSKSIENMFLAQQTV